MREGADTGRDRREGAGSRIGSGWAFAFVALASLGLVHCSSGAEGATESGTTSGAEAVGAGGGAASGGAATGSGGAATAGGGASDGGGAAEGGPTKFGIHVVLSQGTTDDEIALIEQYGVSYTRTAIQLDKWPYTPKAYDKYLASGIHVLLNLSWASSGGGPVPFPTDLATYGDRVSAVLDAIDPPEMVIIENEEINPHFHSGPISDYVAMLKTASPIVHAHGLAVTNGGVYGQGLYALVYRHLVAAHGQAAADAFGTVAFVPSVLKAVRNGDSPALEAAVAEVQAVLDAAPWLDYVNVHHYEVDDPNIADPSTVTTVTPGVVAAIADFVRETTGKPIMANETSIRENSQPALVTSFLQDYVDNAYPYVIWWDNTDGNSYGDSPLNDGTPPFALRPNGEAFRDFMKAYAADAGL